MRAKFFIAALAYNCILIVVVVAFLQYGPGFANYGCSVSTVIAREPILKDAYYAESREKYIARANNSLRATEGSSSLVKPGVRQVAANDITETENFAKLEEKAKNATEKEENADDSCQNPLFAFCSPTQSKFSSRKFIAAVISMARDFETRLNMFYSAWYEIWPQLHIRTEICFNHHRRLMGYPLMACRYELFEYARMYGEDFDYLLLFQDNVLPNPNFTWPVTNHTNSLDSVLDNLDQVNGSGFILGSETLDLSNTTIFEKHNLVKVRNAYKIYAMVIPRKALGSLANEYAVGLQRFINYEHPFISSENETIAAFERIGSGGYSLQPPMMVHRY